jgi:hypothetical protein
MENWTITTELYNTTDPELYMFSNDLIIWIYNENLYKNVNFTSMGSQIYSCFLVCETFERSTNFVVTVQRNTQQNHTGYNGPKHFYESCYFTQISIIS